MRHDGPRSRRRADLDLVRVFGIVTVLLVHCAQVYSPYQSWHIQNVTRSEPLGVATVLAWPWLMPLFMLLAGGATWFSLERRGGRGYLRDRTLRILVPLLLGTLVVVPPMMYVARLRQGRFDGSYLEFYPTFFTNGFHPYGNFGAGHLWFLAYLYLYALLLLAPLLWLRTAGRDVLARADWFARSAWRFIGIPALVLAAGQVALRARYPGNYLFFWDWSNHALMVPALLFGFALAARPSLEGALRRRWRRALAPALIGSVAIGWLIAISREPALLPRPYGATYVAFWGAFGAASWCWMVVVLGAAAELAPRWQGSERMRRAAAGVPLFYVLHQPIIALAAYRIVEADAPIALEFALLAAVSLVLTVAATVLLRAAWRGLSARRRPAKRARPQPRLAHRLPRPAPRP